MKQYSAWLVGMALAVAAMGAAPATQPTDKERIDTLIAQLGAEDPKDREAATQELLKIGQPALDAVRASMRSEDPEVAARSSYLVRKLERRPIPGGPILENRPGVARTQSMRMTVRNGQADIHVAVDGRKIDISRDPAGPIEISITGTEEGKEVTETWKAKNAEDLKEQDADVYAIYEKYAGNMQINNGGLVIQGGGNMVIQGGINIAPPRMDPMIEYQMKVMRHMAAARMEPRQRVEVMRLMNELRIAQLREDKAATRKAAEALRAKITELELPDPGDAVPATQPAKEQG